MLRVYIVVSTNDANVEIVTTLLAESDDQALAIAAKETRLELSELAIYTKAPVTNDPMVIDSTTNYYG